ncbi:MAG TPA: WD40 repeat domain-containing protein [Thermoleophilaceae bacterium]
MTDRLLERELRRLEAPDEGEAALRAWEVTAAEFERLEPSTAGEPKQRKLQRVLIGVAAAAALAALLISPAGATVRHWVGERFSAPGVKHAKPALVSLPAQGRLLVSSRDGAWVVSADGSKRLLGPYRDATWSPHGLYVAAVRGHSLVAVDSRGRVHWALPRVPAPELPSWSPGNGFRVAYLSGSSLRVVGGDGMGDKPLASGVARVAPAWRPGARYVVSYWTKDGSVVTRNSESGRVLWRASAGDSSSLALQWSSDGRTLMALGPRRLEVLDGRTGTVLKLLTTGTGLRFRSAEISPDGRTIALARFDGAADRSEVFLLSVRGRSWDARSAFRGRGSFAAVRWSPDGRWLLVTWRDADQWLFLRSAPAKRLLAVSHIGRAFEPDRRGLARFPSAGGWCCPP